MRTLTGKLIRADQIDVPPEYQREESLIIEEDALFRSIEKSGIQQPLFVLQKSNGRYALIDGTRRLAIAQQLDVKTVPAVIDELPGDGNIEAYQNRLRFVLDEHRQDLFPSQRAALIKQLMSMFAMKQKDVAEYLGVDPASITLWLKIDNYAPEIVKKIDSGEITLHAARSFDGMTPAAQPKAYRSLKREFRSLAGYKLHKLVRSKFRAAFDKPEKSESKPRTKRRPKLTRDEKAMLAKDLTLKEVELADGREELQRLNREITLATPPIRAILRDSELVAMLPPEIRPEFDRFAEIYI